MPLGQYNKADPSLDKNLVHISQVPPFRPYPQHPHDQNPDHSIDWGNNSIQRQNWLFGTYCQGHFIVSFDGLQLADCQCIPMCLSAIIYSNLYPNHPHRQWDREDIYHILNHGNKLYAQHLELATPTQREKLQKEDYFLTQSSILKENSIMGRTFIVERKDVLYGYILSGKRKHGGLILDLIDLFRQSPVYGILIAKKTCRAIWTADGKYYIFDPHATNPHKTAVVVESDTVEDLFKNIKYLLNAKDEQFVTMPYDLIPIVINGPIFNGSPKDDEIAINSMDKPKLELTCKSNDKESANTNGTANAQKQAFENDSGIKVDVESSQAEDGHDELIVKNSQSESIMEKLNGISSNSVQVSSHPVIDSDNDQQPTSSNFVQVEKENELVSESSEIADERKFSKTASPLQSKHKENTDLQNESFPTPKEEFKSGKCKALLHSNDSALVAACRFDGCYFPQTNEVEMVQHILKDHFSNHKLTVDQAKAFIFYSEPNDQYIENYTVKRTRTAFEPPPKTTVFRLFLER